MAFLQSPLIQVYGRAVGQTASVASVVQYTVGAVDGTFELSSNLLVTATSGTTSFDTRVTYTDEGNTSRTINFIYNTPPANAQATITNANGAVPYAGMPLTIRAKAGTTITISTPPGGTYTTVTYNIEACIKQIAS